MSPVTAVPTSEPDERVKVKTVLTDRQGETERPVELVRVSPVKQVLIRAGRTWLQVFGTLSALLLVGALVVDLNSWVRWLDPAFLQDVGLRLAVSAGVATLTALLALGQNALEFLTRLDDTHPTLRA